MIKTRGGATAVNTSNEDDLYSDLAAFKRPTRSEVHSVLRENGALLVHFSGNPPMHSGPDPREFPDDLKQVEQGKCSSGLSCSTVVAGDGTDNASGCVGLILCPRSDRSIVAAAYHDMGTRFDGVRREVQPEYTHKDIDAAALAETISSRGRDSYNEWAVHAFEVAGVFVIEPCYVNWSSKSPRISISTVAQIFPDLNIYKFAEGSLVRRVNDSWVPAAFEDLYP